MKYTTIRLQEDVHAKLVKEVKKRKGKLSRNITASELIGYLLNGGSLK